MTRTEIIKESDILERDFAMADPDGLHGAITRIENKLDRALNEQSTRDMGLIREIAMNEAAVKAAHKRLDEFESERDEERRTVRSERFAVRLALITIFLTIIGAALGKAFGKW